MRPRIVAHRGAAAEAPENTLPAFDLGLALGADALELDVRRSADGALLVIHDPTLDRTAGVPGRVVDMTTAAVRAADVSAGGPGTPGAAGPVRVPVLEEVFARYPGLEITVDVKDPAAAWDVVHCIERFRRTERTILYVDEDTEGDAFRAYRGRRATSVAQAARIAAEPGWLAAAAPREVPEVVQVPLRADGRTLVTRDFVARVRDSGRTVQVWTVDDATTLRRLAEYQVDGIITNDVRLAASLLGARGREGNGED
ncbi:MAG: glycerophosphodiester phosphodiesterase family protein [Gemmatimonadota bacterium]|nr:glycerophosphodiester phosphodiesterase family protein [Gemmatimonadota bacterium]